MGLCPGVAVKLYGEGGGGVVVFLIVTPTSSPPVQRSNQGSGENPALVTKLLRPVQLLPEEQAATLGTPLPPLEGTRSPRH